MVFYPDGTTSNATLVDEQAYRDGRKQDAAPRASYEAELRAYRNDKMIDKLMRQRHGVNM
jgi:hypothetical protein